MASPYYPHPNRVNNKVGKQYGLLLVIKSLGTSQCGDGARRARFLCRCDCGNELTVASGNLRTGSKTRSCGCFWIGNKQKAAKRVHNGYRNECVKEHKLKRRPYHRRAFLLTVDDVYSLIFNDCFYCGISPTNPLKYKNETVFWNGIDRRDNEKGYELSNCVPCCRQCNFAKGKLSLKEFESWLSRVFAHRYRQRSDQEFLPLVAVA